MPTGNTKLKGQHLVLCDLSLYVKLCLLVSEKIKLTKSKVLIIDNVPPVLLEVLGVCLCKRIQPCKCIHGWWHQLFIMVALICWVGSVDSRIHHHTFMLVFSSFCPLFWTMWHNHVHPNPLNPRTQRNRLQHRPRAQRLKTLTFC